MAELKRRITVAELRDWIAFDRIDPIGRDRDDANAANIAASILAVHNGGRPVRLGDVMLVWDRPPKRVLSDGELLAKFKAGGMLT